jgi:hypothetical protein
VDPAGGHRKSADRLQFQVVVELAAVVAVQRGAVAALGGRAHHHPFAHPRQGRDGGGGRRCAQDRGALQVEPRAVQDEAGDALLPRQPALTQAVEPQRDDQAACGVSVHQHVDRSICADRVQCAVELGVVAGQVRREVRRLPLSPRPSALVQIEAVERVPAVGEVVGQLGVEEVIGEAVHGEHSAAGRAVGRSATHQRGDQVAFAVGVGAQRKRLLPVTGQHVWLPLGHDITITVPGV